MNEDHDPVNDAALMALHSELPEAIRMTYTPKQYAWLSDAEKARLTQTETEPEFD